MLLVFANENENRYKAGRQKVNFSKSKLTVYKALYKNFGLWTVYKQKKPYKIVYQRFFVIVIAGGNDVLVGLAFKYVTTLDVIPTSNGKISCHVGWTVRGAPHWNQGNLAMPAWKIGCGTSRRTGATCLWQSLEKNKCFWWNRFSKSVWKPVP